MSRPRRQDDDRVTTSIRLPRDLHARLLQEGEDREVGANVLMVRAIALYLDQLVSVDDVLQVRERA